MNGVREIKPNLTLLPSNLFSPFHWQEKNAKQKIMDVLHKKHREKQIVNMAGQMENTWHTYLHLFSLLLFLMWSHKAEKINTCCQYYIQYYKQFLYFEHW